MDNASVYEIVYYRLAQTDVDGTTTYFNIVSVESSSFFESVKTYPNPFQDAVNVEFISSEESMVTIKITNANGTVVLEEMVAGVKGANSTSFNQLSSLADGIYVMSISNGNGLSVHNRIVK